MEASAKRRKAKIPAEILTIFAPNAQVFPGFRTKCASFLTKVGKNG
jgi:hypothetical protein